MNKNIVKLIFGCSLSLIVGLAVAQRGGGGGHSSGGGVSHSSGGGGGFSGGMSSHSSVGGSSFGGGFHSYGQSHIGGGYSSSGGSRFGGGYSSGSSSHYSGGYRSGTSSAGSSTSRYSGSYSRGGQTSGSTSRYQSHLSGYSSSRTTGGVYHRSQGGATSARTGSSLGSTAQGRSRGGASAYTGNNNRNVGGSHAGNVVRVGSAPHGIIGRGGFGRGGYGRGGFRSGYWGYWGWRDSFFCFPFYCFDPWFAPCYVSPWYYYPCLPPYVAAPNVIIEERYPNEDWKGSDYDWAPESNASKNQVLDDSVQDLVQSFEADDHKAIDRVTAHSGNVRILTDGKYSYSLKANDFYDTYVDGIESTKTDRYQIVSVKSSADGNSAQVVAKHIYNDPSGNRTDVYHTYLLVKEGNEYVIREFGTSNNRMG